MSAKSCALKGKQQLFALQYNQIGSCCRAHYEPLDINKTVADYTAQWAGESQQLDQGIEIPGCEHCWKHEHQGIVSYRQQHIDIWPTQNEIEILLSNLCNHMCSYCSPKYSSQWHNSVNTVGMFTNISKTAKDNLSTDYEIPNDQNYWLDQICQHINSYPDNSVNIKLLGGEPLMQRNSLEQVLILSSKKIQKLSITTNLSPPNNKFLVWLLENTSDKKLEISISLDSHPDYNHVPRSGFDQVAFLNNLQLLKQHNINHFVISVVSVLSIFEIGRFEQWLSANKFEKNFYKINNPVCLDPLNIPYEFRSQIQSTVPMVQEILMSKSQPTDLILFEQYHYLRQYFERTRLDPGTIPNHLFQDYWLWLTNKFENRL
jgi:organic radical activating enzyme